MHTQFRTSRAIGVLTLSACVSCGADPANDGSSPTTGSGGDNSACASPPCAPGSAGAPASCGVGMTPCGSEPEQNPSGTEGTPPVVGLDGTGGMTGGMVPLPEPEPLPIPSTKCGGGNADGRYMECLDRGVIAVPSGASTFVSWRLLGSDPANVGFRLYRQNGGGAPALACETGATAATSCLDAAAGGGASYFVRPVVDSVESDPSGAAARLDQDYIRIPLRPASAGAFVHLGWVGDLDGDGEYEVVVDRISAEAPLVDAYTRRGEFLWRLDTGRLGADQNNIEGGAATISNGHWDGLTVYDFDSDGFAEIAIKTANGFVFGDGTVLNSGVDQDQFVSIVNGRTGAEMTRAPLPADFAGDGPLQCHFGVGYFDGVHPSVLTKCKNRVGSGGFNLIGAAYDFDGSSLTMRWKFTRGTGNGGADYHQIRILDLDGDGKDELADGGYVVDDDGSVLYALGAGVVHGDRFHITDMDPARPGLEGWGIQQDNPGGLETYYYDAATGEMLRTYENPNGPGADMGRGTVADLFPDQPGYEYWSFNGMFSAGSGALIVAEQDANVAWPNFVMQWDGDVGSELLDNNRVGDWDTVGRTRNGYTWRRTFDGLVQARGAIPFYGDIFGDWREEALLESTDNTELRIYTTTFETDVRLYTLVHNPAYRNGLTVHGYKQSHLVDYFLGFGMAAPATPNIRLVNRP